MLNLFMLLFIYVLDFCCKIMENRSAFYDNNVVFYAIFVCYIEIIAIFAP